VACEITPEQCIRIAERMTESQRKTSPAKVMEYATQMKLDQFPLTNDALVYSATSNTWLNGKHRATASSTAGVPLRVLVLEVEDDSIMKVIDGGKPRSVSDTMVTLGYGYGRELAGVGSAWLSYQRGLMTPLSNMGLQGQGNQMSEAKLVTRQDRIAFCEKHAKTIMAALEYCVPLVVKEGVTSKNIAATSYCIIAARDGEQKARAFITGLLTGINASGAALACRRMLVRSLTIKARLGFTMRLGLVLKAYISERNGTTPCTMMLKTNEAFPKV